MSNTRQPQGRPFREDAELGLGYCYSCLSDYYADAEADAAAPRRPRFAITTAPAAVPSPAGGLFMIALPSCWDHLVPNPGAGMGNGGRRRLVLPG